MIVCASPDCGRAATHWAVRHLRAGYLPNPDARAYCDTHRFASPRAAADAVRAPVDLVEFVEISDSLLQA
jgi:hypothetical protein